MASMKSTYATTTGTKEWKTRASKLLEHVSVANAVGLEIGALHLPLVRKQEGQIFYADYKRRDDLVKHYSQDPSFPLDDIVDVDFVLSGRALPEVIAQTMAFDYVLASHVIEHCPDVLGWLLQIASVLRPGGVLALAIPDKRFTFDYFRRVSTLGDIVDAYLNRLTRPSPKQIVDHCHYAAFIDAGTIWSGSYDESTFVRHYTDQDGYERALRSLRDGEYVEVHSYTFTPGSFLEIIKSLFMLGLLPFRVKGFHPTWQGSNEFVVTLERIPDELPDAERKQLQLASVPAYTDYPSETFLFLKHGEAERLKEENERLTSALVATQNALALRTTQMEQVLRSHSWKVTRPARWVAQLLRCVKKSPRIT